MTAADHLTKQPALTAKIQPLLPPGTDPTVAAAGFKNLGQFIAAVHVSHNLGIPFDTLKAKVTGPHAESLGNAIHELKPAVDPTAEVTKANAQAKADQQSTERKG
jgi:hypothetical protein